MIMKGKLDMITLHVYQDILRYYLRHGNLRFTFHVTISTYSVRSGFMFANIKNRKYINARIFRDVTLLKNIVIKAQWGGICKLLIHFDSI
jgi:hypothetical protein